VFLIIASVGIGMLLISRAYTPELVNFVVCQAFLQKMPEGISADAACLAFDKAFRKSRRDALSRQQYLEKLFAISQKLEKIQRLRLSEAEEILEQIAGPDLKMEGSRNFLSLPASNKLSNSAVNKDFVP
jgi:hypothetical protein